MRHELLAYSPAEETDGSPAALLDGPSVTGWARLHAESRRRRCATAVAPSGMAHHAHRRAVDLAQTGPERAYLEHRLANLPSNPGADNGEPGHCPQPIE